MDILKTTIHKAHKQHRCNYCNGLILPNERYEAQVIKGDYFYTWKSHISCQKIAFKLQMFDNCDQGVTSDDFHEYISEEYMKLQGDKENYDYPEFPLRLAFVCNHYENEKKV